MGNFIEDLKNAFANIISLVENEVKVVSEDIDKNISAMQTAYDNIKSDRKYLGEISGVVLGFANDIAGTGSDAGDSADDAETVIGDCYQLVADGYIIDESYPVDDDEEEVDEQLTIDTDSVA